MAQHLPNIGSCWLPRTNMTKSASAHSKTKYLLLSQVCRYCLLKVLLQTRRRQWHQRKGSIYLLYKWANTAFWQRYGRKSQLKSSKCLVYQGADNAFWLCTGRTNVKRKLTFALKVRLKTWRLSKLKICTIERPLKKKDYICGTIKPTVIH